MKIQIQRLYETTKLPTRADNASAGYDLYADISDAVGNTITLKPGETRFISTGIACAIPNGYFGAIYARSGLSCRHGLRPANCVGVVDSSYRGEIMVALHNDNDKCQSINHGDRIAQLIIQEFQPIEWEEVEVLDETERGDGGFGHSGK